MPRNTSVFPIRRKLIIVALKSTKFPPIWDICRLYIPNSRAIFKIMTTAKRLQLMFVITVLFGLSSIFSIVQLSKATQFHHINFLSIANVLKLHEELSNYPPPPSIEIKL